MKKAIIYSLSILCSFIFGCIHPNQYADYSSGSGFDRTKIDSAVLQNLEILGRVWGFVKYHHPKFSNAKYDLDCELFELLPQIADVSSAVRNEILTKWIDGFGPYQTATKKYEAILASDSIAAHCINIEWIRDTATLGQRLSDRLVRLRYADRKGNYYVSKMHRIYNEVVREYDNPAFDNEKSYSHLSRLDYGYRLLAVFRFWNMVEYFFPSKYLTDKDWSDVLPEYIQRMVCPERGDYRWEAWRMIAEINDNHARGANTALFGDFRLPLNVGFVNGKLLVITPDTIPSTIERHEAFCVGDEIIAVNGKPVDYYISQTRQFIPCSNQNGIFDATADIVFRTQSKDALPICYRRGKIIKDTLVNVAIMQIPFSGKYLSNQIGATKMLDTSIGYISPAKYKYPDQQVLNLLTKTQGLIIDMRCYPTGEFANFMTKYIVPDSIAPPFRMSYPIINLPGVFYEKRSSWSTSTGDKYPHPIVVLVDSNTQSYAETSVQWMQTNPRVMVIGTQSAGANGNVSRIILPTKIESRFSGLGWYYPDGWVVNRQGVKIDIEVKPTVLGIKEGRDEALETAIRIINKKTHSLKTF